MPNTLRKFQYILEGIDQEQLTDILVKRLKSRYPDISTKYEEDVLHDAAMDVASFHAGAEELGTSDIGSMIREVIKNLERFNQHGQGEKMIPNSVRGWRMNEETEPERVVRQLKAAKKYLGQDPEPKKEPEEKETNESYWGGPSPAQLRFNRALERERKKSQPDREKFQKELDRIMPPPKKEPEDKEVTEGAAISTSGKTDSGYTWKFEAGREVPFKTDVDANTFIRVTDPAGKTVAGVWADVDSDSLVVEYSQVFDEELRGKGLYTDLLKSLSKQYDVTSDTDTNNAAVSIYKRLGADYDARQAKHTLRKQGVAEGLIEDNYNKNDAGIKAALQAGVKLIPVQPNNDATGKPIYIHDYSGRYTVVVDMGGIPVPFYVSTGLGGKAGVAVDKWYPFFGIGPDGWINKGSEATINDFYGSNKLKRVAQVLDNTLGLPSRAKNVSGWPVNRGDENYFISIVNRGLDPAERSDRSTKLRDNMLGVLRGLGEPNKYVEKAAKDSKSQGVAEGRKKKNKKTSRSLGRYFFPGYGYYGSGESGDGGGDGGGGEGAAEGTLNEFDHARHVKLLNTHMKKLGYKNIGAGTDAQVFAKETGPVKKILMPKSGDISTAENSFLAFYNYCQANARNPHLPKFHQIQDNIELDGERFRQITMERLEEVDPEYEDMLVSMTDGIEDGTPLDPQYQPYIKFYQTLKSVMLTGRKLGFENDIITFQSCNIMQRGNTLVIMDPWIGGGDGGGGESMAEGTNVDIGGIQLNVVADGAEVIIRPSVDGYQAGYAVFDRDGSTLVPADLAIDEEFRGQGIAKTIYDYVKSLGFTIRRSSDQTKAGKHFWDKNRGEDSQVWEQTMTAKELDEACWKGYHKEGMKTMFGKQYPNCVKNKKKKVAEGIKSSKLIINEQVTYKLWESAGRKIVEAQLTTSQINQLFANIEQNATAAGNNRTMLGKGKDAASAINTAWEDLKTKVQNSGPIKNVDAMYDQVAEKLKQATGGDQGVMMYVQKYRDFAKKHPIAQSLIYSALIAAAGISGAGLGGAAALGLFKMVDKLLQGEKFSSAAYQGAKTGAMAYGASKVADYMKGGDQTQVTGTNTGDMQQGLASDQAFQDRLLNRFPPDQGYTFDSLGNKYIQVFDSTGRKVFQGDIPVKTMDIKTFVDLTNNGQMATPGISSGSISANPMAGVRNESINLSESQIYLVIGTIVEHKRKLDEGIMDTIKGAAGKAMNWVQTKGANLTTKITADKLLQAWNKAGSPTDSSVIAGIIQNAGVPSEIIKQVYSTMKIPSAGAPTQMAAPVSPQPTTAPPSRPTIGNTPINPMQVKSMQSNIARDKQAANMPAPNRKTFATDRRTPAQIAQMRRAGFSEATSLLIREQQGLAEEKCPHCNGPMFSEEMINEKKDSCYYKVKSRYKVWPSAYASGALVKCRKKGADSWGNSTKNESSILEGIEQTDENLHKWFKEKWVRFGPDGKIRGDCARGDDSEGKPKCLPQSKAQNLGKKGRASAAARKRREDPNPERSGKAINVATKKKTSESSILQGISETKGLPMPGSYEQENKPFLRKGGQKLMALTTEQEELDEKWSDKYKRSIDCNNPKGFSQRAHCQGRKKK